MLQKVVKLDIMLIRLVACFKPLKIKLQFRNQEHGATRVLGKSIEAEFPNCSGADGYLN